MQDNSNIEVLNSVYRGAVTGETAIKELLCRTDDSAFRSDLKTQAASFVDISTDASRKMRSFGARAKDVSAMKKVGMKMGIDMNTLVNTKTEHLAELMIKGSNMGIINMTKVLNQYPAAAEDVRELANRLITFEQNNIERLKTYLR